MLFLQDTCLQFKSKRVNREAGFGLEMPVDFVFIEITE